MIPLFSIKHTEDGPAFFPALEINERKLNV